MGRAWLYGLWIIALLLVGCGGQQANLTAGTYTLAQAEGVKPYISLQEENQFVFVYDALSSNIPVGTYAIDGTSLVLTDSGGAEFRFQIQEGALVFDKKASAPLQIGGKDCLIDGAVFVLQPQGGAA